MTSRKPSLLLQSQLGSPHFHLHSPSCGEDRFHRLRRRVFFLLCQRMNAPYFNARIGLLIQFANYFRRNFGFPECLCDIFDSTGRYTFRYVSIRTSSTLLSRRGSRSMIAVSKGFSLSATYAVQHF